ncbi:MAG: hypothetical protein ACF8PN_09130 [Phycisphaerales bacterium]
MMTIDTARIRDVSALVAAALLPHSFSLAQIAGDCPTLYTATYLGGSDGDVIRDIDIAPDGSIVVAGGTVSSDYPATPGAYDTSFNGVHDVLLAKFDAAGALVWATYIGGPNYDRAYAVEVGADGTIYVAGRAGDGYPTTPGVVQPNFNGDVRPNNFYGRQDGFVTRVSADGSTVLWSTYFGTGDREIIRDIDVDASGAVYIAQTEITRPHPLITPGAYQTQNGGQEDVVVAKLLPDASGVEWATWFGGTGRDGIGPAVRVHSDGTVFVVSSGDGNDTPTTPGAFDTTHNGGWDFHVSRFSADGAQLLYGTFVGGSGNDGTETHNLGLDAGGHAYVIGGVTSSDFPTTPDAFQRDYAGTGGSGTGQGTNYPGDAVVAKLSPDGSQLLASTFIGGRAGEAAEGGAVTSDGTVYLTGATYSDDFPTTAEAHQTAHAGAADAFAVVLASDFSALLYSSFHGGTGVDLGRAAWADESGRFVFGGHGDSVDWPTRNAAQNTSGGMNDGIFAALFFDPEVGACGGYRLGAGPLVAASPALFEVSNATPGARQYLGYSITGLGSTPVPPLNVTLDLDDPRLAATGRADAQGEILWTLTPPAVASGREIWIQAAEFGRVTNTVSRRVQ